MLKTKCAICGNEHEFDWSFLCKECTSRIARAKEHGREAIRAAVLFNMGKIGFRELKTIYNRAGFVVENGSLADVIGAVRKIAE